ncbi:MAG: carbohydrate ABC transporter permease [Pleurocapsa sp. SU_196_0]|nr:carbohydrate ABC transporter permease [Pleurocapsa sp. SU_196_0]
MPKGTVVGRIGVALLTAFVLLPIFWLAYSAFLSPKAVLLGDFTPRAFTLDNFAALPFDALLRPLLISIALSSLVAFLQLVIALPAAYAVRNGSRVLGVYLFLLSVPTELLLIPLYGVLKELGLLNNPLALVLPFLASPFTVFLLYSGISKVPWTLVEAARLDGATNLQILARVIAPILRPELTAAAVLGFAAHWNLVLYPKSVMNDSAWKTVQVALSELLITNGTNWGLLGAAALVTSLPILLLYLFFERRVTKTLEGGLK